MNYTPKEILSFVEENDVKFIRLTFTDIYGGLKNIAIMPGELPRAFEKGIPFDPSFFSQEYSDLLLFPDISTLSVLPWRPKSGRVIRFFCHIRCTDGSGYKGDLRRELESSIQRLSAKGYECRISTKCEFYLFNTDDNGEPTKIPHDSASCLDIAPVDRCENTRREICLSLEEMGFKPQSSRHTYGPGQNEIDFKISGALTAADNMVYYKTVVKNVAAQNGLFASFMPKPLPDQRGSGLHIGISVRKNGEDIFSYDPDKMTDTGRHFIAGVLNRIGEMTCFLDPATNSYKRIGEPPRLIGWSFSKRSQAVRVPFTTDGNPVIEVRTSDAVCNPYIAFKLILDAGFEGIDRGLTVKENDFTSNGGLPLSLSRAVEAAKESEFVRKNLSPEIYRAVFSYFDSVIEKYDAAADKDGFEDEYYFGTI